MGLRGGAARAAARRTRLLLLLLLLLRVVLFSLDCERQRLTVENAPREVVARRAAQLQQGVAVQRQERCCSPACTSETKPSRLSMQVRKSA